MVNHLTAVGSRSWDSRGMTYFRQGRFPCVYLWGSVAPVSHVHRSKQCNLNYSRAQRSDKVATVAVRSFAHAEFAENPAQNVVGRHLADDLAEVVEAVAQVQGDELVVHLLAYRPAGLLEVLACRTH